jgi:hypothetical protein
LLVMWAIAVVTKVITTMGAAMGRTFARFLPDAPLPQPGFLCKPRHFVR